MCVCLCVCVHVCVCALCFFSSGDTDSGAQWGLYQRSQADRGPVSVEVGGGRVVGGLTLSWANATETRQPGKLWMEFLLSLKTVGAFIPDPPDSGGQASDPASQRNQPSASKLPNLQLPPHPPTRPQAGTTLLLSPGPPEAGSAKQRGVPP